jgi:hypothetical protein
VRRRSSEPHRQRLSASGGGLPPSPPERIRIRRVGLDELHVTERDGRPVPLSVLMSRMRTGRPPDPGIKGRRQKVTLMLDSRVYRKVRGAVDQVKGVSVSDLVSDLLGAVVDELAPVFLRMAQAKNHTERLQILDEFFAEASGAQALEYARTYTALMAAREKEDDE